MAQKKPAPQQISTSLSLPESYLDWLDARALEVEGFEGRPISRSELVRRLIWREILKEKAA